MVGNPSLAKISNKVEKRLDYCWIRSETSKIFISLVGHTQLNVDVRDMNMMQLEVLNLTRNFENLNIDDYKTFDNLCGWKIKWHCIACKLKVITKNIDKLKG